ncbi:host specificity protein J [Mesoterricola silvestris]|uniref:Tip attachment protein J domain-containing protein n=1 Tax=Mesoterricola silvestris TaxID=2927979 RepID=A0AA48GQL3_9BACT|nr:phage tail protein [Mesoterricola silvestris]BDU72405.1 hypothetical protein METEAL_15790 [Mesoterricola silvestris]
MRRIDWNGDPSNPNPFQDPGLAGTTGTERGKTLQILSEGPIQGLSDGLKSVYLDGTPVQGSDGSFNTSSLAVGMTAGTLTQVPIPGIQGVESETIVNTRVSIASGAIPRTISTSGITAVRIRLRFPQFRGVDSTTGASYKTTVTLKIERQSASWNGGAWEVLGNLVNSDNQSSASTKAWRIELPAAGPWTIRITRLTADSTSDYLQNETWWDAYTVITDAKLSNPYMATIAVSMDSKLFSSIPEVTAKIKGRIIKVPANYTPSTRAYATTGTGTTGGGWDGTFKLAWTDNPAWIFYDLCTNTRYGAGNYLNVAGLDKWALYTIAQWCDVLVDDGNGGTEPRFRCSLYIQGQDEAIKILSELASVFWGIVYYAGGTVSARADVDSVPAALYVNANVEDGRFEYTGTAYKARHTAALVTWSDPSLGYASAVEYVEDAAGIARYGYNPVSVTAVGCTSKGQARRYGKRILATELMQTETVDFISPMEGAVCVPGDIIQVHDKNRAGKGRWGGRIVSATSTSVTLDAPVTLASGKTYTLKVRQPDGTLETRTVTNAAGTFSTLTSAAWTLTPTATAVWMLQEGTTASLYRTISIVEKDPGRFAITALSHDPTKYALIESNLIAVGTTGPSTAVPAVTGLAAVESVQTLTDRVSHILTASWGPATGSSPTGYNAAISREYGPWNDMPVSGLSAVASNLEPGSYRIRVFALYGTSQSAFNEVSATVTDGPVGSAVGDLNSPNALTNLEKGLLVQKWNDEAQTKTQLDAQASTYTVSATAYDNAVVALSTGLIAAGAPSNWATSWPDGTTFTATGIVGSLSTWWANIASTRAALQGAINAKIAVNASSDATTKANAAQSAAIASAATDATTKANAAYSSAVSSAATDATTKALDAINKSQLHAVAWASSALPTLPNGTYPAGYLAQTTDNRKFQVNAAGNAWGEITQAAIGIFGQVVASQMVLANLDNLIPNPTSEQAAPAGGWPSGAYEAAALYTGSARTGNQCRSILSTGTSAQLVAITPVIPCTVGDQVYLSAWMLVNQASDSGHGGFYVSFTNANGSEVAGYWIYGSGLNWSNYVQVATNLTAPGGAVGYQVTIGCNGAPSGYRYYWDDFYLRRMADSNLLVDGAVTAQKVAAKAILAQNMVLANLDNLIPNPNSEAAAPSGGWPSGAWEAVNTVVGGIGASLAWAGTGSRVFPGTGNFVRNQIAEFPANEGDQYYFEAQTYQDQTNSNVLASISIDFCDASGSPIGTSPSASRSVNSGWVKLSFGSTAAPSGTVKAKVYLGSRSNVGYYGSFDNLYCRRMADANLIVDGAVTAQKLEAVLAILGIIKDPNYIPGSTGNVPTGFKLSGPAFTTTFIDGTTDANCHMEMAGTGNFGGYKVATVNTRVFQTYNRISNGFFYRNLAPWATTAGLLAYNTTSSGTGTGSAMLTVTGTFLGVNDSLSQTFISPALQPGQTVTLDFKTGWATNSTSGLSNSYVKAYIVNLSTGTETLLATYNYTHSGQSLAWTQRSVSITSYVSAGGEFGIRLECDVEDNNSTTKTASLYVDEVKVII